MLDVVQIGLDVVGAIPGVGIAANVVNAGISMARGDKLGAGLSLVACIPFAGPLAKGAKMAKAIGKAVSGLAKGTGKVMNTVQKARNIAQTAFQEVLSVVKPLKGKMTTGSKIAQNKVVKDLVEIKTAMKAALDKVQSNLGGKMATEFAFDAGYSIEFEYMAEKTGVDLSLFSLLGTRPKRNLGATSGRGSSSKNRNTKSNEGKNSNKKEPSEGTGKGAAIPPAFKQTEFASSYKARINQTPGPKNPTVEFKDKDARGESKCTLKPPPDPQIKQILDEAGIDGIKYKNAVPDFSPVTKAQVEIDHMLGGTGSRGSDARRANFAQADQKLADQLNNSPELARKFGMEPCVIKPRDIERYRERNKLTWHELNDVKTTQLVPTKINSTFGHLGGVGEINAGAFEPGGFAKK